MYRLEIGYLKYTGRPIAQQSDTWTFADRCRYTAKISDLVVRQPYFAQVGFVRNVQVQLCNQAWTSVVRLQSAE